VSADARPGASPPADSPPDGRTLDGAPLVVARRDAALRARVVRRVPLCYAAGADPAIDRPAHVRAGSGLARLHAPAGERLAVVQDDANFVALVDPATGRAESVTLPAGVGGRRTFSKAEGTKQHKLDLEACCLLDDPRHAGGRLLVAFGSGSTDRREQIVVVAGLETGPVDAAVVTLVDASALYAALRAERAFAGAELNVEGAARLRSDDGREVVRLYARGNGAGNALGSAASATCDLDAAALAAYLVGPAPAPAPRPTRVVRYDLGAIGGDPAGGASASGASAGDEVSPGERLGFTDATRFGDAGAVLYVAAAEASVDVYEDGEVAGSAVGVIDPAGGVRWTPVTDADGAPFGEKVEGVAFDEGGRLWVVVDQDDPEQPSELCLVELDGVGETSSA
jgi:hypothetical protein